MEVHFKYNRYYVNIIGHTYVAIKKNDKVHLVYYTNYKTIWTLFYLLHTYSRYRQTSTSYTLNVIM